MFRKVNAVTIACLLSLFVFSVVPIGAVSSQRLTPTNFVYQGAFRLPEAFSWGARGMTYYPQGNSRSGTLLIIGFDLNQAEFAQVAIPQPVISRNWQALPLARQITEMTNFDGNIVESVDPDTAVASGIEYVTQRGSQTSDKLYGAIDQWYIRRGGTDPPDHLVF